MELRKVLATLLAMLKLLPRRQTLLAIGVVTVLDVIAITVLVGLPGDLRLVGVALQLILLLAASPVLARTMASPDTLRGPILWGPWLASGVIAVMLNMAAAFGLSALLLSPTLFELAGPPAIVTVLIAINAFANLAGFIPLVHLVIAVRGDRRFAPGDLPGALAPAQFAWLGGAFLLGLIIAVLQLGIGLINGFVFAGTARFGIVVTALATATGIVLTLLYAIAAADFAVRPRRSDGEVFA